LLNSAANALRALECLVEQGEAGVSEIGRHLGVTVGTSHRILVTLVELGFAEQNPATRRYRPSSKVLSLAQQMRGRVNARDRVHLHLVELVQAVRESAHLAVLDEGLVLYIDKVASDQSFGIEFRVGSRLPAHSTALGKALLAFDDEIELETVIKQSEASEHVDRPVDRGRLQRALRTVRAEGVAEDRGEFMSDVRCVAAPIRGRHGHVVAAIDISAPRSRFDAAREQLRAEVQRSAERISEELRQLGVDDLTS
jgi:IclR family transcriptional regulator, KDG regulon repressor